MVRLLCLSDLHGQLINNLPSSDIVLIPGDVCPISNHSPYFQANWINTKFARWCESLDTKEIYLCPGNHCFVFQDALYALEKNLPFTLLHDKTVYSKCSDLIIYGSGWTKSYGRWALQCNTEEELARKYSLIPDNVDIILSHGPAFGCGDLVDQGTHEGSTALRKVIERIQPPVVLTAHIHCGYGEYSIGKTKIFNCSILNDNYELANKPWQLVMNNRKVEVLNER